MQEENIAGEWIIDSGCSRHMTGNKNAFTNLEICHGKIVTFGDNSKGQVKGKGTISLNNVLIKDVLFVSNLKYNLISASQLCDHNYHVAFLKDA